MKKVFKVLLKVLLAIVGLLVIAFVALKISFSEEIPAGVKGRDADELALKMLNSLNYNAFNNAEKLEWSFRGVNHYSWEPQKNIVTVTWDDNQVELNTKTPASSTVFKDGNQVKGQAATDAIEYAQSNFNNDSFWLVAPFKVMDPGTVREVVTDNGRDKLLVRYTSGGTTPGDVYLWTLDQDYRPESFKMWVQIIPLDGIEAQWRKWQMTDAGFPLSMEKTIYGLEIPITDVSVE